VEDDNNQLFSQMHNVT